MSKPTIYEVLKEKLGREPTHTELVNEVKRILSEARLAVQHAKESEMQSV